MNETKKLSDYILEQAKQGEAINTLEQGIWDKLLTMGEQALGQFVALQGDGDMGEEVEIASGKIVKRLPNQQTRIYRTSIEQRPGIVDKKSRFGDWEGDTIMGKGRKSALLTLVERKSLYTIIAKLDGKHAEPLAQQMVSHMKPFKNQVKVITLDNGLEFSAHQKIAGALWMQTFILLIPVYHGSEVSMKIPMA